jgi:hypothetical protein
MCAASRYCFGSGGVREVLQVLDDHLGRSLKGACTVALVNELAEAADDEDLFRVVGGYARFHPPGGGGESH